MSASTDRKITAAFVRLRIAVNRFCIEASTERGSTIEEPYASHIRNHTTCLMRDLNRTFQDVLEKLRLEGTNHET